MTVRTEYRVTFNIPRLIPMRAEVRADGDVLSLKCRISIGSITVTLPCFLTAMTVCFAILITLKSTAKWGLLYLIRKVRGVSVNGVRRSTLFFPRRLSIITFTLSVLTECVRLPVL